MTGAALMLALLLQTPGNAQVQKPGVDPDTVIDLKSATCWSFIEVVDAQDGRADVLLVWAHGYHAATVGVDDTNAPPMTWRTVEEFGERLQKACRHDPKALWLKVIRDLKRP